MNIKELKLEIVAIFLLIIIPYKFLGDEFSSVIIALVISIALIKGMNNIKINKHYLLFLITLVFIGLISMSLTNNIIKSLSGLCIYISFLLTYLFFSKLSKQKESILELIVYFVCIFALIFIIFQGAAYRKRIDGNIGYANTYALILLSVLYLNEIIRKKTFYIPCQLILLLGIFYTASRNTLVYLAIFVILTCIYNFKNKDKFSIVINAIVAFSSYAIIQLVGFAMIFVLPIIIYSLYYFIINNMKAKYKNLLAITLILIGFPLSFLLPINFIRRLKNISFSLGVFQERLIYFEDVIPEIFKNIFGAGINSFEYKQYLHQSAFYDVRYIHNSILQISYDIGILGGIIFTVLLVLGFIIIKNSTSEDKKYFIPLYITIYLHSLLDFDFSYITVIALVTMLVAFFQDGQKEALTEIKVSKAVLALIVVFTVYLSIIHFNYFLGDIFIKNNKLDLALKTYNINKYIAIKDPEVYSQIARAYKLKGNDRDSLENCIRNLKKAERINSIDPRIIGNLAFAYQALEEKELAISYYESFLDIERYYSEMYKIYYDYLNDLYKSTSNKYYKDKIDELESRFYKNIATINPRARYIKDQLPKTFEELVKKN